MARIDNQTEIIVKGLIVEGLTHRQIQQRIGVGLASISRIRNRPVSTDIIQSGKTADTVPEGARPTSVGVIANDAQVPFHDPIAINLFFDFCRQEQPDWIDLNGDWLDFYQISRFLKDPKRKNAMQDDINLLVGFSRQLRETNPKAKIYFEQGNHEERLRKFLWKNEEIACLDCLRLEKLLKFDALDIVFIPKWRKQGDLYITHGTIVRKHAGYTARAMFDKYGVTMIHGHTHRDGKFTHRTLEGHKAVWENYCLCSLEPEYVDFPDWTQGFSKVTMVGKRPYVEQIPVINGQYFYGGKMYGKEKTQ